MFQFHFLLPEFSALDNVMLPMRALGRLNPEARKARAMELLGSLGLADHARKRPDQLSGGQRQRVAIARALANDPPLILADEPTGNLDTASSEQVLAILRNVVDGQGKAVVVVTHDLDLAARAIAACTSSTGGSCRTRGRTIRPTPSSTRRPPPPTFGRTLPRRGRDRALPEGLNFLKRKLFPSRSGEGGSRAAADGWGLFSLGRSAQAGAEALDLGAGLLERGV